MTLFPLFSNQLEKALSALDQQTPKNKIAVAVSGGADSFAMLHLAMAFCLKNNSEIMAVTVDHGLRSDSADEAEAVHDWCKVHKIQHFILRDESFTKNPPKSRLQEKARRMRYELIAEKCRQEGVAILLIGQHLDDQIETIVMRSQRSSELYGLTGMPLLWHNLGLSIIRPLLVFRKNELIEYCKNFNLPFIDDPSNENSDFERVQIRQDLASGKINEKEYLDIQNKALPYRQEMDAEIEYFFHHSMSFFPERAGFIDKKYFFECKSDLMMRVIFKCIEFIRDKYRFFKIRQKKLFFDQIIALLNKADKEQKIVFGGVEFCFVEHNGKAGLFFYREPSACTNQIYKHYLGLDPGSHPCRASLPEIPDQVRDDALSIRGDALSVDDGALSIEGDSHINDYHINSEEDLGELKSLQSLVSKKYLRALQKSHPDCHFPDYYFYGNFLKTFPVLVLKSGQRFIPFLSLGEEKNKFIFSPEKPIEIAFRPNMMILKTSWG